MKSNTLIMVLALGGIAFLLLKRQQEASQLAAHPTGTSPTSGTQAEGPQDVFGSVLATVTSIFQTAKTIAQTSSKST